MPTYVYACTECAHRFEQHQAFTDEALTECPECGSRLRKVFNSVGVVFKGSGFYRTDSRGKGPDAKGPDGKGSDGKGSDAKSTDAKSTDAKGSDAKASAGTSSDGRGSGGAASGGKGSADGKGSSGEGSGGRGSGAAPAKTSAPAAAG